jgi:hypothetical protein
MPGSTISNQSGATARCNNPGCRAVFVAKRSTKRFCSDSCKMRVARRNSLRAQVLTARWTEGGDAGPRCDECNLTEIDNGGFKKWYVYSRDGTTATARLLCNFCHSAESRTKFYLHHPDAGPGWGSTRAIERRTLGLPKRKPGKRPPREIAFQSCWTPDRLATNRPRIS